MIIESTTPWGETTLRRADRHRRRHVRLLGVLALLAILLLVVVSVRALPGGTGDTPPPAADCHTDACTGKPGETGAAISRAEVAARVRTWVGDTGIPYSMVDGHAGPGGWGWYRRDCSGFVSMALRLPDDNGGFSTVELADVVVAVPARDLRPYDLIGRVGPGSAGENGHVQLFLGWADASRTRVRVVEQGGLVARAEWPHEATYDWPERLNDGTELRTYRYTGIRD